MVKHAYRAWLLGEDIYSNTILYFCKDEKELGANIEEYPKFFSIYEKSKWTILKLFYRIIKKEVEPPSRGKIIYFENINELLEIRDGVILIDEGQVLFNARNWEQLPYEFQYKLQQHRKHRLDLYVTTQNMGTIDITYRRLVQAWYHCKDKFALFGIRNPNLWSIHEVEHKDVDCLYTNVDDLRVETVKTKHFTISRFKRRLYDTMYDIGFKRFRTIWIEIKEKGKYTRKVWIIPKQMKLNDVLRLKSSYLSALNLSRLKTSKRA